MNCLGLELQAIALQGSLVEKLVDKLALVAFGFAETRDESRESAIFERELDELAFLEKREHARGIGRWIVWFGRDLKKRRIVLFCDSERPLRRNDGRHPGETNRDNQRTAFHATLQQNHYRSE